MPEIQLRWFVRCVMVPVIAWAIPRVIELGRLADLREVFDLTYNHRDEEWRRHVWSLAAERAERGKVSRGAT